MRWPDARARLVKGRFQNGRWATWFNVDGKGINLTKWPGHRPILWTKTHGRIGVLIKETK